MLKGIDRLRTDPMVCRLLDGPPVATVALFPGGSPVTVRAGEQVKFKYRGRDYEADIRSVEPWGWRCRPVGRTGWMSCSWDGIGAEG
jgi:hypothetical protein